jgi:hypothetical protein
MADPLHSLLTVFLAQLDSAMTISDILSKHNGDEKISPDSLIIGLIYRLMVPMTDTELHDSMVTGKQLVDGFYDDEESDEGDDEEYEGDDESFDSPKSLGSLEPKTLRPNNCNCEVCAKARACLLNYPSYEACDPLADKFHKAIQHACAKHKLRIS